MRKGQAAFIAAFITAAFLVAVPVSAQTVAAAGVPLTLAEAEQRALDGNPEIATARLGMASADYTIAESRAAYVR